MASPPTNWRRANTHLAVLVFQFVFVLILLNFLLGRLRFANIGVNYHVFTLACLLPIFSCVISLRLAPSGHRWSAKFFSFALCGIGVLALVSQIFLIWYVTEWCVYPLATAPCLQPKQTMEWNGTTISVREGLSEYPSTYIVQEVNVIGPLVWRRELTSFYLAMDVKVTPIDAHHLRCMVSVPGRGRPVNQSVILLVD